MRGTIVPVLYVRRAGALSEHTLPPHPLHAFDSADHVAELRRRLEPLLAWA